MANKKLHLKMLKMYDDVEEPSYQTSGSAGCDIKAYLDKKEYPDRKLRIYSGETKLIPTGLKFSVPEGYELQVRPRSGLSLKTKLRIANSPGTLDSDYRGELMVIMENTTSIAVDTVNKIVINHGDRIAQIVFAPVVQGEFEVVPTLDETERGSGGFGSTGK